MSIIGWFRRRTRSPYADDRAVADFTRVARDQGLPLDYDRDERARIDRLAAALSRDTVPTTTELEEIAMLLGQTPDDRYS